MPRPRTPAQQVESGGVIRGRVTSLDTGKPLRRALRAATDMLRFRSVAQFRVQRARRVGLQELGLPYVSDPGVTRHLAAFLSRQRRRRKTVGIPGYSR